MTGGKKMTIFEIKEKLRYQEFEICLHAFEEAVDDFLSLNEVINAILQNGEIIEDDPDGFRCLVHCKSKKQHIHVVFDYHDIVKGLSSEIEVVTIYKPDPALWINYRKRKR
jgi:hypothetical protein